MICRAAFKIDWIDRPWLGGDELEEKLNKLMTRSTEKLREWIGRAVVDVKLDEEEAALAVEPVHPACLAATGEVFWDIAD